MFEYRDLALAVLDDAPLDLEPDVDVAFDVDPGAAGHDRSLGEQAGAAAVHPT